MVEWTKENVLRFIEECRRDEGLPMFKTRFAGHRLPYVIGICWGGHGNFKDSEYFEKAPEEDIRFLEEGFHDWQRLLMKWGYAHELSELSNKYGLYLRTGSLPKIRVVR